MSEQTVGNKQRVAELFERWSHGDRAAFFDAVSEDVRWTVVGSCPGGGTYASKAEFLERSARPVHDRLMRSALPEVQGVYGDGERVFVLWTGSTTTKDGRPYNNSYCWVLRMRQERIVEIVSYLDSAAVIKLCAGPSQD
jgi:hypothetical protein